MSAFQGITKQTPRPMPIILLADVSGSMHDEGKIHALNAAVRQMLDQFKNGQGFRAEIQLAVITFGTNRAEVLFTPRPARLIEWTDLEADGGTPMGMAFELALQMIEDRSAVPERAYRSTIILVTDGEPTDAWRGATGSRVRPAGRRHSASRLASVPVPTSACSSSSTHIRSSACSGPIR